MRGMALAFARRAQPLTVALADTHPATSSSIAADSPGSSIWRKSIRSPRSISRMRVADFTLCIRCRQNAVTRRSPGFYDIYLRRSGNQAASLQPCSSRCPLTWLRTTLSCTMAGADTQSARSDGPTQWSADSIAMKAHIDARIDYGFRRDAIAAIRSEWMVDSFPVVLTVDRSCGDRSPDYPDDPIAEPRIAAAARSRTSRAASTASGGSARPTAGDRSLVDPTDDEELPPLRTTLTRDATRTIIARNTSPTSASTARSIPIAAASMAASTASRADHAYLGLSPGLDSRPDLFKPTRSF